MQPSAIEKDKMQSAMIAFSACFGLAQSSAIYVSAPITTGKNYLEWMRVGGRNLDPKLPEVPLSREVFVTLKNIEQAIQLVKIVRKKYTQPVIDPTVLEKIDDWSQSDYHHFWISVIKELVSTIVFAEGWEYSNGSTLEYICGLECGLTLLTHDFKPINPRSALTLLETANHQFSAQGVVSQINREATRFLEKFIGQSGSSGS